MDPLPEVSKPIIEIIISLLKNAKPFIRVVLFVTFVLGLLLLNDSSGFISNIRLHNKIEQIKELELIIQSRQIDPKTKINLQNLESQIIQDESFFEGLSFDININNSTGINSNVPKTIAFKSKDTNFSNNVIELSLKVFWHIFSSAWGGVILFLFGIFAIFIKKINMRTVGITIFFSVTHIIFFSLVTLLFPKSNNPTVNYLINALFNSIAQLVLVMVLLPKIIQNEKELTDIFK